MNAADALAPLFLLLAVALLFGPPFVVFGALAGSERCKRMLWFPFYAGAWLFLELPMLLVRATLPAHWMEDRR